MSALYCARLSKVCRLWYEVGRHPSLWSRVDLSAPCVRKFKKSLVWLCRHRMAATTSLTLSGWNNLVDADLEVRRRLVSWAGNTGFV